MPMRVSKPPSSSIHGLPAASDENNRIGKRSTARLKMNAHHHGPDSGSSSRPTNPSAAATIMQQPKTHRRNRNLPIQSSQSSPDQSTSSPPAAVASITRTR